MKYGHLTFLCLVVFQLNQVKMASILCRIYLGSVGSYPKMIKRLLN